MLKKIVIPLSVVNSLGDELPVYIAVQKVLTFSEREKIYIAENVLYYEMFGEVEQDCRTRQYIKRSLLSLYENGYIVGDPKFGSVMKRDFDEKYFVCISLSEYEKIMRTKQWKKLLKYFCFIVSRCINTKQSTTMSVEYITKQLDIDCKTVYKYNTILKDLELINIKTAQNQSNTYSRFKFSENNLDDDLFS